MEQVNGGIPGRRKKILLIFHIHGWLFFGNILKNHLKFISSMLLTVAETKFFDMNIWMLVTALNVFVTNIYLFSVSAGYHHDQTSLAYGTSCNNCHQRNCTLQAQWFYMKVKFRDFKIFFIRGSKPIFFLKFFEFDYSMENW